MPPASDTPVLLYDGDCGLCASSVQFLLRHEPPHRRAALRFAPLQGAFAAQVRARHPELMGIDSVVWVDTATPSAPVRVRSDAALQALTHLGGGWALLAALGRVVPRVVRDTVYAAIARRRLSLVAPRCLLPSGEARARFLA
jgi:predicted DCC family thiol-disulfide oxidoreductase YuxK